MGLFSRLLGWSGVSKGAGEVTLNSPQALQLLTGGNGRAYTGTLVSPATAIQVSAVYACVRNLSEDIAKLWGQVYRLGPDGEITYLPNHPLQRLLNKPNRWHDKFMFWQMMMMALLLRGNAYAIIRRNGRGEPVELIPVQPDRVSIHQAYDGMLFYRVGRSGYLQSAQLDGTELEIPEDDVLHIRGLCYDGVYGLSPISAARQAIALSQVSEQYQAQLMGKGARPGGVLESDKKIEPDAAARLKAQWENLHHGIDNVGATAVLEDGVKWKEMGLTNVDAQFLEQRRLSIEEIARFFRMPLHKIGELQRSTNNNIEHQGLEYATDTVSPWVERIETALDFRFGLPADVEVEFDMTRLYRADLQTLMSAANTGKTSGILNRDEARKMLGMRLGPTPGGKEFRDPLNTAPPGDKNPGDSGPGGGRPEGS